MICLLPPCPCPRVGGLGPTGVNPWHKGARLDYQLMWKHLYGRGRRLESPRSGGGAVSGSNSRYWDRRAGWLKGLDAFFYLMTLSQSTFRFRLCAFQYLHPHACRVQDFIMEVTLATGKFQITGIISHLITSPHLVIAGLHRDDGLCSRRFCTDLSLSGSKARGH